jgi:hypothetical protein
MGVGLFTEWSLQTLTYEASPGAMTSRSAADHKDDIRMRSDRDVNANRTTLKAKTPTTEVGPVAMWLDTGARSQSQQARAKHLGLELRNCRPQSRDILLGGHRQVLAIPSALCRS